jgi:uridine kinase
VRRTAASWGYWLVEFSVTVRDRDFSELASLIRTRACPHPVRLVAIDGGGGSGKSTFASLLAQHLDDAPVIPMDDFLAWDDLTEYFARFVAQVVEPLLLGRDLRYQQRDWLNDMMGRGLGEFRDVPFRDIVIFEGIGSARRALERVLTYSIWIDAPDDLRLARGLSRDGHIDGMREVWLRFMAAERRFFELEDTAARADAIVDGTTPFAGDPPRFRVISEKS